MFIVLLVVSVFSSITLVSCKAKKVVVEASSKDNRLSAAKIIDNHNNNKYDFSTLYIKSNVHFANEKQSQNVTAEIKIKKDEKILISVRFLGITMVKALITPTVVSYYNKINSTYFEGDFGVLSQFLGTNLDFAKVQNILIGKAIDNLDNGKYILSDADQLYRLDNFSEKNFKKSFYFDTNEFLLKKEEIIQSSNDRMIQVAYSHNKVTNGINLPKTIDINAYENMKKTEINFDYNTINVNDELSFPYSVPDGYKRVIIK